jgi:predicted kinase
MESPVLLIGGSASVGKTTVAGKLAGRAHAEVVHIDDRRDDIPGAVNYLRTAEVWDLPPTRLIELLLEMTASVGQFLTHLVTQLLDQGRPVIVEGEGIEPQVVERFDRNDRLRTVFIVEDDPAVLWTTFARRASGHRFLALSSERQEAVVEMNRLYGLHLKAAATASGYPCIQSRPWDTLETRVLLATGLN